MIVLVVSVIDTFFTLCCLRFLFCFCLFVSCFYSFPRVILTHTYSTFFDVTDIYIYTTPEVPDFACRLRTFVLEKRCSIGLTRAISSSYNGCFLLLLLFCKNLRWLPPNHDPIPTRVLYHNTDAFLFTVTNSTSGFWRRIARLENSYRKSPSLSNNYNNSSNNNTATTRSSLDKNVLRNDGRM